MKTYDVTQGTPEWQNLRLGIPTASSFHRILTPAHLKPSSQADTYMAELILERQTGEPFDAEGSSWMQRGKDLEAEARRWYEFQQNVTVDVVGFVADDGLTMGGSPDGLVGSDGVVEIKCRSKRRHIEVLLGKGEAASRTQVQGLLWLTGRDWCDVVHYCPGMRHDIRRMQREPATIEAIAAGVRDFITTLDACAVEVMR